jgi:hypothetical protein
MDPYDIALFVTKAHPTVTVDDEAPNVIPLVEFEYNNTVSVAFEACTFFVVKPVVTDKFDTDVVELMVKGQDALPRAKEPPILLVYSVTASVVVVA